MKVSPEGIWTPGGLCKWAGASSKTPSSLCPTPTKKKKALTECSSWSMLWARTGLKETGDRAPGFFLTARICRRARKAVAEGRAHIRQVEAGSSTTEALRAPGTRATHPPHSGPRTSRISQLEAKQSPNRTAPEGTQMRPGVHDLGSGGASGAVGRAPPASHTPNPGLYMRQCVCVTPGDHLKAHSASWTLASLFPEVIPRTGTQTYVNTPDGTISILENQQPQELGK